jgi:hypothetical protein
MNWEAIGAIAETLGAIGVILTLAYLALQVRQNSRAIRFQSGRESASLIANLATTLTLPDMVESQLRSLGAYPAKVSDGDMVVLENILFSWLIAIQQDYFEYRSGLHSEDWWESKKRLIGFWLTGDIARNWWKTVGRAYWTKSLQWTADCKLHLARPSLSSPSTATESRCYASKKSKEVS